MELDVRNIDFSYPRLEVLEDISFSIDKGDYVAVLGTNGTGKSTLLKCISKILQPDGGTVYVGEIDYRELKGTGLAKNIGYVPQRHDHSRKTVFDTVLLGRKPYIKWDVSENDMEITRQVIERLGLEDYTMRYTSELSGGELQKVIIARALAQEPRIMLMDEPTSNLDLRNQIDVLKTIKEIVEEKQISAVVAMHDLNLALKYANKFLLLKDKNVYSFGDKSTITEESIKEVYDIDVYIEEVRGELVIIPKY